MVLIALGTAATKIINSFSGEYKRISITSIDFPDKCEIEEDYETYCPKFKKQLSFKEEECWFVLSGGSMCSSAALRIMENIKDKKINLIYICPDSDLSGPSVMKRHKVIFNVLQQYTRSGLINSMCLISNKQVLKSIGNQPINKMYSSMNTMITNTIETIMWFKSQEPVMGSLHKQKEISRIYSVAIGDMKNNEEKMLFLLDNPTETWYIYSISKQQMENNKDLIPLIKERISGDEEKEIKSSFAIYPSDHKQSYFYSVKYTHYIQPLEDKSKR